MEFLSGTISPDITGHAASVMDDSTDAMTAQVVGTIVHVDMDVFYTTAEQRDELRSKVAHRVGFRIDVAHSRECTVWIEFRQ